jgi:hypothetical protein
MIHDVIRVSFRLFGVVLKRRKFTTRGVPRKGSTGAKVFHKIGLAPIDAVASALGVYYLCGESWFYQYTLAVGSLIETTTNNIPAGHV